MRIIKLTEKQYQILRAIVRNLVHDQRVRNSYTKQKHCSRKNEKFNLTVSWKAVTVLSHCEDEFSKC